jgi:tight adherence protein C
LTLILIAGLVLLAVAIALLARGLALSRAAAGNLRATIDGYGFSTSGGEAEEVSESFVGAFADRLGAFAEQRLGRPGQLRRRLIAAGMYETPAGRFIGYQILLAVGLPVVWLVFSGVVGAGGLAAALGFFWALLLGIGGPIYYLARKVRLRQGALDKELPELIDLLVVTMEAGVGFAGSLRIASERMTGPLGEELRLTLQEQNMGLTTTEALKNFGDRSETPGVRIFVRSIAQGETLGVSMGQIMRNVAAEMRKRRRALAEERAQKAPVKLLFPLIFLIFPAMFIVLLLPAIIAFFRALSG